MCQGITKLAQLKNLWFSNKLNFELLLNWRKNGLHSLIYELGNELGMG